MIDLSTLRVSALVLFIVVIIFWAIKTRPWKTLTGEKDSDDIKEDRQLLTIDREAAKDEKDENYQAKKLKNILSDIYEMAMNLSVPGVDIKKSHEYLEWINGNLDVLAVENIDVDKEKHLIGQINTAINLFLHGMPQSDKKIAKFMAKARGIQVKLYGDIEEEGKLLRKKEALLREEFEKAHKELAD